MVIIKNSLLPFDGYKAMAVFPFIFVRKEYTLSDKDRNHEKIHCTQQGEMLTIGAVIAMILCITGLGWWSLTALGIFYWWYIIEYIIRLFICRRPYRNISFEQEAYLNESLEGYLVKRKYFAWIKYIWKSNF